MACVIFYPRVTFLAWPTQESSSARREFFRWQLMKNSLDWDYLLITADLLAETLGQPSMAAQLHEHRPPDRG